MRHQQEVMAALLVWLLTLPHAGCMGSIYDWQIRTSSTPPSAPFRPADLEQQWVAIFPALTMPGLRGNEVGIGDCLGRILHKGFPAWKVVGEVESITRINRAGLAPHFSRLRSEFEISQVLDRDLLRDLATALHVRYVFQPQLAAFSQTMTDRWFVPGLNVRVLQTRSSIMRLSLHLWDAETGDLVWKSVAETTMSNEAMSQDPVYLEDIARAVLGSMMIDLVKRRTASQYTPLNKVLGDLIREAIPQKMKDEEPTDRLGQE